MTARTLAARRGAPAPAVVLELFKPVTWFPPMWAFACGLVASGQSLLAHWPTALAGVILAGPLVCATSQAVNDWYDRHVDAINEPDRPIPSGRLPGRWGFGIACGWTMVSLAFAAALGRWVLIAAAVGLALAWAYSAPPVRLKRNGWLGNAACGFCYEGLAWVTGGAVLIGGALPVGPSLALAAMFSFGAHGIMTLNDFKSVEGDSATGIRSLPVALGPRRAARVACAVMAVSQAAAAILLLALGHAAAAGLEAVLILVQLGLMARFLRRPTALAVWYSGVGVPFFVLGMLISALAVRASSF